MLKERITIVGAGPAGVTAAIFLGKSGIPVTLIDKEHFPRDKVCGDCLGFYALSVMHRISMPFFYKFAASRKKLSGNGVRFFGPEQQQIIIEATNLIKGRIREVALCKREEFDDMLLGEALATGKVNFIPGIEISHIVKEQNSIRLYYKNGSAFIETEMLILASGAQTRLIRSLTGETFRSKEQAAGIRAYFSNVSDMNPEGYIELHFLKELAPGYLWIFPLPDNLANVGLGLRTDVIKKKKTDIKRAFHSILQEDPYFKARFKNAVQVDEIAGFPLALSMKNRKISGDRYLLAGDTAHLIEPLFGEGIGHAMYSGKFAAEHMARCLKAKDFSAVFNKKYDREVYRKLGSTLKFSRLMHRMACYPSIMNMIFNRVQNSRELQELLLGVINGKTEKKPWNGIKLFGRLLTGY